MTHLRWVQSSCCSAVVPTGDQARLTATMYELSSGHFTTLWVETRPPPHAVNATKHVSLKDKPAEYFQRRPQDLRTSRKCLSSSCSKQNQALRASYQVAHCTAKLKKPHNHRRGLYLTCSLGHGQRGVGSVHSRQTENYTSVKCKGVMIPEAAGVEVFWISSELWWQRSNCWQKSHSLQALQKLDGRFFCLSFQLTEDISYCYIVLLINVLNLRGTLRTKVRYYIAKMA